VRARKRAKPIAERRAERAAVDDPHVVLDAALRFLEARQRATAEVRRRLVTAGYQPELVEGAITRLTELGILDDEAFARAWVESRDRARPRGERALRVELRQKGIRGDTVDEVIEEREAEHPEADAEAAARLLRRNRAALARVTDPRVRRQRAYALLARSGFDSETAVAAINAAGPDSDMEIGA
jgi:regulatory protein